MGLLEAAAVFEAEVAAAFELELKVGLGAELDVEAVILGVEHTFLSICSGCQQMCWR